MLISDGYNEKVDLWAIGILIYELFVGKAPFDIRSYNDLHLIVIVA